MLLSFGGKPPAPTPLGPIAPGSRILFSGDSITKGFTGGLDDPTYRWSAPLESWMTAQFVGAGKTPPTYLNTAITGQQTRSIAQRAPTDNLDAQIISQTPDRVFLLTGTNDIGNLRTLEETRDKLHQIIVDTVAALPSCRFYVLSLFLNGERIPKGANPGSPPNSGDGPWDARNSALYAGLFGLEQYAQWIYLRDAAFEWLATYNIDDEQNGGLTQDDTHPNKVGQGFGPISGQEFISSYVQARISLDLT